MSSERAPVNPDVSSVVGLVLDGVLGQREARELLSRPPDLDDFDDLKDFQSARWNELAELVEGLDAVSSPGRVRTTVKLGAAAADLLGDKAVGTVLLFGAVRLVALDEDGAAAELLTEAEPLLADHPEYLLTCRRMAAGLLARTKRHEEFDARNAEVIAEAERLGDRGELAMGLLDKATALANRGRALDAVASATTALAIRQELDDRALRVPGLPTVAKVRLLLAQYEKQAGAYQDALAHLEEMRSETVADDPYLAAYALSEIGFTWGMLGDWVRADAVLAQAAREAEAIGRTDLAFHWRLQSDRSPSGDVQGTPWQRATALFWRGPERAEEAVDLLRGCVREARESGDLAHEADARNNLGLALSRAGQPLQGELALRVAISAAERLGDVVRQIRCRTNLAAEQLTRGRRDEALAALTPAIEMGESLRRRAGSTELRQNVAVAIGASYDVAIMAASMSIRSTCFRVEAVGDSVESEPQPELLIELGQRARAANFVEWLRVGQAVEESGDPALVSAMLDLRAAETAMELAAAEMTGLGAVIPARDAAARRLERTALAAGTSVDGRFDPVTLAELAAVLRPHEVVVDILEAADILVVTCVDASGRTAVVTFGASRAVRRTLRRLRRARREYQAELYGTEEDLREARSELDAAIAQLDDQILRHVTETVAEFAGSSSGLRLLVSPENELLQLPFWRLASHLPGARVSVLPTVAAIPLLRRRRRDGGRPWVSVTDASGSLAHAARDVPAEAGYVSCAPRAATLVDLLPRAGRVHVACHGHFDTRSVYRSGLEVLADLNGLDPLGAPHPGGQTGLELFTAAQITGRLHLPRCELVILSACDSGLPRKHVASEFTSLPGALLVAGARNVVASLWPAHDGAAATLMHALHQELLGGSGIVDALTAARRRTADIGRAEASALLGEHNLPPGDHPFADGIFTDCFQHYGVD